MSIELWQEHISKGLDAFQDNNIRLHNFHFKKADRVLKAYYRYQLIIECEMKGLGEDHVDGMYERSKQRNDLRARIKKGKRYIHITKESSLKAKYMAKVRQLEDNLDNLREKIA